MDGISPTGETDMETFAVKSNQLLIWMSARQEGSWAQFRGAVEELHVENPYEPADTTDQYQADFPLYQQIRLDLQRLAHCEFYANGCEKGWRVAPPIMAVVQHGQEWWGFYCGARSLRKLRALKDHAGAALEIESARGAPDIMKVRAGDEWDLRKVATNTELLFQPHAPMALLLHISPVGFQQSSRHAELPAGRDWKIDRFVPEKLAWEQVSASEPRSGRMALYRFVFRFERHHYLCSRGSAFAVSGQGGKYVVLRRAKQSILKYNHANEELRVPAICRPPILIERALSLCSGKPPLYDAISAEVVYKHVPTDVARLASELLRQDLQ